MKLIVHDNVDWTRAASLAGQCCKEHPDMKVGIRHGVIYQHPLHDGLLYVYRTKTAYVVRSM